MATMQQVQAADYSAGVKLGSPGGGASLSVKHSLQFRSNDQIQTRYEISKYTADPIAGRTFANVEYHKDKSYNDWSARASVDWYPFAENNRFFIIGGFVYSKQRFMADADSNQSYIIGSQRVNPGDNITTNLDIDHNNPLSLLLGIGWGKRIGRDSGFSFLAEIGLLIMSTDIDVTLKVTDPDSLIPIADIEEEKKQIENQFDGVGGLAAIGLLYQF